MLIIDLFADVSQGYHVAKPSISCAIQYVQGFPE